MALNSSGKVIVMLPGEPYFVIRAKDNKSVLALSKLTEIYDIPADVLRNWSDWRDDHPADCQEPD